MTVETRIDEQTFASGSHSVVQSEAGLGSDPGREDTFELAQQFDVNANQITQRKSQLLEGAEGVFGGDSWSFE
jgi:hypothetical protein